MNLAQVFETCYEMYYFIIFLEFIKQFIKFVKTWWLKKNRVKNIFHFNPNRSSHNSDIYIIRATSMQILAHFKCFIFAGMVFTHKMQKSSSSSDDDDNSFSVWFAFSPYSPFGEVFSTVSWAEDLFILYFHWCALSLFLLKLQ